MFRHTAEGDSGNDVESARQNVRVEVIKVENRGYLEGIRQSNDFCLIPENALPGVGQMSRKNEGSCQTPPRIDCIDILFLSIAPGA